MKKEKVGEGVLFVFSCIAIGIIVAAAFLGSLEEQYQKNKAWERQFLPRITEDFSPVLDFQVTTPDLTDMFPSGDYILLRNVYGTNLFHLSFFLDDKEVCHWDTETAHPYSFQEKGTIYISEQNCSGMGDFVVSWDLSQEKASLNGEDIPVWTLTGSRYFKN